MNKIDPGLNDEYVLVGLRKTLNQEIVPSLAKIRCEIIGDGEALRYIVSDESGKEIMTFGYEVAEDMRRIGGEAEIHTLWTQFKQLVVRDPAYSNFDEGRNLSIMTFALRTLGDIKEIADDLEIELDIVLNE